MGKLRNIRKVLLNAFEKKSKRFSTQNLTSNKSVKKNIVKRFSKVEMKVDLKRNFCNLVAKSN